MRALILSGMGLNCEEETAAALHQLTVEVRVQPISFFEKEDLNDIQLLVLPGGFSYGDALGSGKALSNWLHYGKTKDGSLVWSHITDFIQNGGFVLGICNGFQALVKTGLIPNLNGNYRQTVTLEKNQCGYFHNRWVRVWDGDEVLDLPIRHGEGRVVCLDDKVLNDIRNHNLAFLKYVDADENIAMKFPENPNGSVDGIAGLRDLSGKIWGLMPHPEAAFKKEHHPFWNAECDGKKWLKKFIQTVEAHHESLRTDIGH